MTESEKMEKSYREAFDLFCYTYRPLLSVTLGRAHPSARLATMINIAGQVAVDAAGFAIERFEIDPADKDQRQAVKARMAEIIAAFLAGDAIEAARLSALMGSEFGFVVRGPGAAHVDAQKKRNH